jgi:hypothetical protein
MRLAARCQRGKRSYTAPPFAAARAAISSRRAIQPHGPPTRRRNRARVPHTCRGGIAAALRSSLVSRSPRGASIDGRRGNACKVRGVVGIERACLPRVAAASRSRSGPHLSRGAPAERLSTAVAVTHAKFAASSESSALASHVSRRRRGRAQGLTCRAEPARSVSPRTSR